MRKSKFSESEIVYAVKQVEAGVPVVELARKYGVTPKTVYLWRKKYGGLSTSELARLKQLEEENRELKRLVADLSLDKHMLQEVLRKSAEAGREARAGRPSSGGTTASANDMRAGCSSSHGALRGTAACSTRAPS